MVSLYSFFKDITNTHKLIIHFRENDRKFAGTRGFNVFYSYTDTAEFLSVEIENQCTLKLSREYTSTGHHEDDRLEIEINRPCLDDYVAQLINSRLNFPIGVGIDFKDFLPKKFRGKRRSRKREVTFRRTYDSFSPDFEEFDDFEIIDLLNSLFPCKNGLISYSN